MNDESILNSTKKLLGLDESYEAFDLDVVTAINTCLATLAQVGVGPETGFQIEDDTTTWRSLLGEDPRLNLVRSYVFLSCRMQFDPPPTSFAIAAVEKQLDQLIWRIKVVADPA